MVATLGLLGLTDCVPELGANGRAARAFAVTVAPWALSRWVLWIVVSITCVRTSACGAATVVGSAAPDPRATAAVPPRATMVTAEINLGFEIGM